jgi:hypothetical protein
MVAIGCECSNLRVCYTIPCMAKIKDKRNGRFIKQDIRVRFLEKTKRDPRTGCLIWQGFTYGAGYGRLRDENKKNRQATHVAWYLKYGSYPTLFMCHKCDNPKCVDVRHLFEGDVKANAADSVSKDRHVRGSRQKNAILTEDLVRNIKSELNGSFGECTRLGKKYGVTYSTISKIKRGLHWKHVV